LYVYGNFDPVANNPNRAAVYDITDLTDISQVSTFDIPITAGNQGSPLTFGANHLAAMPLHSEGFAFYDVSDLVFLLAHISAQTA